MATAEPAGREPAPKRTEAAAWASSTPQRVETRRDEVKAVDRMTIKEASRTDEPVRR